MVGHLLGSHLHEPHAGSGLPGDGIRWPAIGGQSEVSCEMNPVRSVTQCSACCMALGTIVLTVRINAYLQEYITAKECATLGAVPTEFQVDVVFYDTMYMFYPSSPPWRIPTSSVYTTSSLECKDSHLVQCEALVSSFTNDMSLRRM